MLIALGTLVVTALLITAAFVATQGDVHLTRRDLDTKRAYYAARAGVNTFHYQLTQNPDYWKTCTNDVVSSPATVPGSSTGVRFTYQPVYNQGYTAATCPANPIAALIDKTSGLFRMKFTGYSGSGIARVSRTLVATFRKDSPLDYLWYTVYETKDPITDSVNCSPAKWNRQNPKSTCQIVWANDGMAGPMYTQDQYLIGSGASPTFGRDKNDDIKSLGSTVCSGSCGGAKILGNPIAPASLIPLPTDSTTLAADASLHGELYAGTTNVALAGTTAIVTSATERRREPRARRTHRSISRRNRLST